MGLKIAIVGAGSLTFTRTLVSDLMGVAELQDAEFALMDINEHNLEMTRQLIERDFTANGLDAARIRITTDQREAVTGARYIINTARVGGLEAFTKDIEIPLRYGVDQCVGDTLSAGGIMYGQRGIAMLLDLCRDIREVGERSNRGLRGSAHLGGRSDGPLLLNYANPMAMMTWAANRVGGVNTIGLCHGVQGGHHLLADALEVPAEELEYVCAGINHQTWYIQLRHKGVDLTGRVLEALEQHPTYSEQEKVRIDMLRRFGYFSTESNGHLSEYLPWYRRRPEETSRWIDLSGWIHGETGGYLRVCTESRNWFEDEFPKRLEEEPPVYSQANRSHEHGSYILEALETGRLYRGHFNVVNNNIISNLPDDAVVEVPGYIDGNGVNIPTVGDLPMGCAAVCNASVSVQRLAVMAAVEADVSLLKQAMLMDPLVGAVCNPPEVWQMTDEMLVELSPWLPQYQAAGEIAAARERLERGPRIPTRQSRGAARKDPRSPESLRAERDAEEAAGRHFHLD